MKIIQLLIIYSEIILNIQMILMIREHIIWKLTDKQLKYIFRKLKSKELL